MPLSDLNPGTPLLRRTFLYSIVGSDFVGESVLRSTSCSSGGQVVRQSGFWNIVREYRVVYSRTGVLSINMLSLLLAELVEILIAARVGSLPFSEKAILNSKSWIIGINSLLHYYSLFEIYRAFSFLQLETAWHAA